MFTFASGLLIGLVHITAFYQLTAHGVGKHTAIAVTCLVLAAAAAIRVTIKLICSEDATIVGGLLNSNARTDGARAALITLFQPIHAPSLIAFGERIDSIQQTFCGGIATSFLFLLVFYALALAHFEPEIAVGASAAVFFLQSLLWSFSEKHPA